VFRALNLPFAEIGDGHQVTYLQSFAQKTAH
jgi:hypothetical protein